MPSAETQDGWKLHNIISVDQKDLQQLSWQARMIRVEADNSVGLQMLEQTLQRPWQRYQYDTTD